MAKKIIRFPGRLSLWALRCVGTMITFIFTFFVYATGQVIQTASMSKSSGVKSGTTTAMQPSGAATVAPAYGIVPPETVTVAPDYGVIALYGMPHAEYSIKGTIRSEISGRALENAKVIVADTTAGQAIDSTFTDPTGSFSVTFSEPPWNSTWILEVKDADGLFVEKDTLISIPNDSLKGASGWYSGSGEATIELFLKKSSAATVDPNEPAPASARPHMRVSPGKNRSLEAQYGLPVQGRMQLALYDVCGRLVRDYIDKWESAGQHETALATSGLAAGAYFLKLQTATHAAISKVMIAR